MATSVGVAMRTLFIVLLNVMVAAYVYEIAIDGLASCFNLRARWAIALATDHLIYVAVIGAWFVHKESSWILTVVFVFLNLIVGSIAACGYILIQFYKLSPEESSEDLLYFVLKRHKKADVAGHRCRPSVVTARVIFSALFFFMLGALIYTILALITKPLQRLTDVYIYAVILSVWIAYKESSWISAFLWILSLVCLGNVTTCVYIVRQLFYLSPQHPVFLIIFNNSNRYSVK